MNGSKKRILITGGLGNLGTWMTEHFARRSDEYEVAVLARSARQVSIKGQYSIIECDITQ